MRFFNVQQVARPQLWDRNPTPRVNSYGPVSVAPHTQTTRWSYTVPAGRKFQLGSCNCAVSRDSAAAPASSSVASVQYTPSGGAAAIILAAIFDNPNATAVTDVAVAPMLVLLAGDVIAGITVDPSTGGGVSYITSATGTEGDA